MQYRVAAFKCKVNSVIELTDDMIPLGAIYDSGDLYVICLDPIEEKKLPEEEHEASKVVHEQGSEEPNDD